MKVMTAFQKIAASAGMFSHSKSRSGRRPLSVVTLLKKDSMGTLFKRAQDEDSSLVGKPDGLQISYESKMPVRVAPPTHNPQAEYPQAALGGGVSRTDGRNYAVTVSAPQHETPNGDVVPDALPHTYKNAADAQAQEAWSTLEKLKALDKNKLTPGQIGRYAALGAVAGPGVGILRNSIQGRTYLPAGGGIRGAARHIAGDALAGALTSGAIPVARSWMDRQAAVSKLKDYVEKQKTAGINWSGAGAEHATDLAGLGAMALASGSHLVGQLRQRKDPNAVESGPISTSGQAALDLGGLAAMATPTVAALHGLAKNRTVGAGGGSRLVNAANLVGLAGLAIPAADKLQAHLRAQKGEDAEKKMLLGHGTHKALELGGYGSLMAGSLKNPDNSTRDKIMQGVGYGALALPHVVDVEGPTRSALELGGLGSLALPSILASKH